MELYEVCESTKSLASFYLDFYLFPVVLDTVHFVCLLISLTLLTLMMISLERIDELLLFLSVYLYITITHLYTKQQQQTNKQSLKV